MELKSREIYYSLNFIDIFVSGNFNSSWKNAL